MSAPSTTFQCLSSGLRRQVIVNSFQPTLPCHFQTARPFSQCARLYKRPTATPPSVRSIPKTRAPPPPPPPPPSRPPASAQRASSPPPPKVPPSASSSPVSRSAVAEKLLQGHDEVLLYKAPSHTAYYAGSWIVGGLLVVGAGTWFANLSMMPEPEGSRWFVTLINSTTHGTALIVGMIGVFICFAPSGIIRTIKLRAVPGVGPRLRFTMRNPVPFTKGREVDVTPAHAVLDPRVTSQGISYTSVPLSEAENFTKTVDSVAQPPRKGSLLIRMFNALWREVRRVGFREGFAYVDLGAKNGTWKLDLQGCEILEHGQPLEQLMTQAELEGWASWLRRLRSA